MCWGYVYGLKNKIKNYLDICLYSHVLRFYMKRITCEKKQGGHRMKLSR